MNIMAATKVHSGKCSELQVDIKSDNLETNCQYCSTLNSELQKAKDEILSYKEIIKALQEEPGVNVRPEQSKDLRNQSKTTLMEEDWILGTTKGKRNHDARNRNLIQIIPTNPNKYELLQNLKDDDKLTNLEKRELGVRNTMKYTLKKDRTKCADSQGKYTK
jgi:hypothetical protein